MPCVLPSWFQPYAQSPSLLNFVFPYTFLLSPPSPASCMILQSPCPQPHILIAFILKDPSIPAQLILRGSPTISPHTLIESSWDYTNIWKSPFFCIRFWIFCITVCQPVIKENGPNGEYGPQVHYTSIKHFFHNQISGQENPNVALHFYQYNYYILKHTCAKFSSWSHWKSYSFIPCTLLRKALIVLIAYPQCCTCTTHQNREREHLSKSCPAHKDT